MNHSSNRYQESERLLDRALRTIPLGSQTFSKSKTQYPRGVSPFFIQRGLGSQVWDVDGNPYTDWICSLAAVSLGYRDPDVDAAVRTQLDEGVIFSLPHPLEMQVAEKICEMVPCAEMVRFGKNGSDATAGAVRIARAATRRDRVAVCGYHGWQDWYIGSTARNRGVPKATSDLTHTFAYNQIESLDRLFKQHPGEFAAVILEPINVAEPTNHFLAEVGALCRKNGAIYIFDETITGFRFANGGAQEYFGVTPDLATFGKGLANGYPVSAVAGRTDLMMLMEEVFFSFTFGGETLSLAAALATMTKLTREPVIKTLWSRGEILMGALDEQIKASELTETLSVAGMAPWSFLVIKDAGKVSSFALKTLFLQEMFTRNQLIIGSHNMCYAHSEEDVHCLIRAYGEVLPILKQAVSEQSTDRYLRCKPLEPLFKVR